MITGYNEENEAKVIFDIHGYMLFCRGRYDQFKVHNQLMKLTKNGKYGIYHPIEKKYFPCIIDEFIEPLESPNDFNAIIGEKRRNVSFKDGEYHVSPESKLFNRY